MSYLPASYSSTTKAAAPTNSLNGHHPAIDLPLHTDTRPRQFGRPSSASEAILASGTAVPPGPVGPHTSPILTARAGARSEARDRRLDVFESEACKNNMTRLRRNDPAAKKYLVDLYSDSQGVQPSDRQADHWIHKAAAQGHAGAQHFLGLLYFYGLGVKQDDESAFKWYQQAAEQGHGRAQSRLGWLYFNGRGVKQDDESAFKWIQQAVEQGDAVAQWRLGWLYLEGRGVQQNDDSAFKWFQLAAEQGDAVAQWRLGWMYLHGRGVKQDDGSAFKWIQQAAEQGDAGAQWELGWLYLRGRSVKKDDRQAAYWILKSGLSADGLTQSCAAELPVELVKYLLPLFTETPEWQRVRTLGLSGSEIDDEAAAHLAQLITENQTLEALDLRNNPIGQDGAALLAEALRSNQTLKELHLDLKGTTAVARADIARALDSNKNITVLMEEVKDNPAQHTDELPFEIIALIEQAAIVADQKAGAANRTLEQTQALLKELRLSVAQQVITGQNQPAMG